jgi:hypothetical protein
LALHITAAVRELVIVLPEKKLDVSSTTRYALTDAEIESLLKAILALCFFV